MYNYTVPTMVKHLKALVLGVDDIPLPDGDTGQ
jgi:hypothetical protein